MPNRTKIVFCWSDISGYMAACWKALASMPDIQLRVYAFGNNQETEFNLELTQGMDIHWVNRSPEKNKLVSSIRAFEPDIIVLCGWFVPAYRKLVSVKEFGKRTKFILTMDTPWLGTIRQQLGRIALQNFVGKIDAVITSGERSYQYASRLGAKRIVKIQYGVDVKNLSKNLDIRLRNPWPKSFLYVGRFAHEKGIEILMDSYRQYRKSSNDPWSLQVCGKGPLGHLIKGEGIRNHGFLQPDAMDEIWQSSGCLILSSSFDPWPLIVVEACAAGLPVICTHESGSQVEVVKAYWNGLVIPANDKPSLLNAMNWIESHFSSLNEMGSRSRDQALPYSAEAWVQKLTYLITSLDD